MHSFQVWAPKPKSISVQCDGAKYTMSGPDERGWWRVDVEAAHAGSDYCFLIDDDATCFPDPRSQWQPAGVHGASRVYDQDAFAWNDAEFRPAPLPSAIVYELHIGTFTPEGTLDAAIAHLDYLKDLGITHVELMPIASFTGNHGWGYDGVALFSVHEPYGGPDALKRFIDAAHGKGLAVLLDVVYNHFGPVGNYTGKFGPYLIDAHHTPWGGAMNLEDAWSHEVRRFLADNATMWMRDYHFDGLRLDAVHALVDRSAIHFLEQLSAETEVLSATLERPLVLIAESDLNDPRIVIPREAGGMGMDAQWSDDFHHALFSVLTHETEGGYYADFGDLKHLAKALEESFIYDGVHSKYRNRIHGRSASHVPQHRFLGFIQNHDQVGNRALGDRIHESIGIDRAKIAAAVVLMSPFVPMIFQGEEWAASTPFQYFADHDDPELARLVSEGRKREFAAFGWNPKSIPNPEKRETFERSKLNWKELHEGDHAEMLDWYRRLIQLRHTEPSLHLYDPGETEVDYDDDALWLTMQRGDILLALNLSKDAQEIPVPSKSELLLFSGTALGPIDKKATLPPDTVAIFKLAEK